ncbi:hypothetical protein K501DRAFT_286405 [Backusella circina FSU 941]|nr:hypothetical protein K501DRAFT_286405 [Backusella circina FSU 941]
MEKCFLFLFSFKKSFLVLFLLSLLPLLLPICSHSGSGVGIDFYSFQKLSFLVQVFEVDSSSEYLIVAGQLVLVG